MHCWYRKNSAYLGGKIAERWKDPFSGVYQQSRPRVRIAQTETRIFTSEREKWNRKNIYKTINPEFTAKKFFKKIPDVEIVVYFN